MKYFFEKLVLPMLRADGLLAADGFMDRTGLGSGFDDIVTGLADEERKLVADTFRSTLADWIRLVVVHRGLSGRVDVGRAVSIVLAVLDDHTLSQHDEDDRLRREAAAAVAAVLAQNGAAGAAADKAKTTKGGAKEPLARPEDVHPTFKAAVDREFARWQAGHAPGPAAAAAGAAANPTAALTSLPLHTPATPFEACDLVGELRSVAALHGFYRPEAAQRPPPRDPAVYERRDDSDVPEDVFRDLVVLGDLLFAIIKFPASKAGTAHATMAYLAVMQVVREHRHRYRAYLVRTGYTARARAHAYVRVHPCES